MRSLPHITIACGAVWGGSRLLYTRRPDPALANLAGNGHVADDGQVGGDAEIDYRLVALGSLLPDLVDRVQRRLLRVRRSSPDQHFVGHTLLLNVPLLFVGVYFWRRSREAGLLAMSAAAMTHLLVDPVIRSPATLFWPLLGFEFPPARGLSPRLTAVTQIVAAATVVVTIVALQRRNRLGEFISKGRL